MALIGFTIVFDGYDAQLPQYIMPQVMKEWGLAPVKAGAIASYGFIGLMIGAAGFGMLSDRIGRKKVLMISLSVFSIFCGAAYFSPDYSTFCFLRFLAGLGMGGAMPVAVALVSEYAPPPVRAKVVTAMMAGFPLGAAVGAVVAMFVVPAFGWRMMLLMAFLPLAWLFVLNKYLPESIRFLVSRGRYDDARREVYKLEKAAGIAPKNWTDEEMQLQASQGGGSIVELFKYGLAGMTILLWFAYFFNLMVLYGLIVWVPTLLYKAGFSLVKSYSFGLVQGIGPAVGGFLLGMLMDRVGRKSTLVLGYCVGAVSVWLFGTFTNQIGLYAMATVSSLFILGGQNALQVVAGETYPTRIRSTGIGWAMTMGRFGAILGPILGGAVMQLGLSFKQYFIVFAIPCVILAVIALFFRVKAKDQALDTFTAAVALEKLD
jgi:AAHS family benzoate transporter-like MFS transporter